LAKGKAGDISIVGVGESPSPLVLLRIVADVVGAESGNPLVPFGEHWLGAFKETKAYAVWDSVTDPVLFDLCEPRLASLNSPQMVKLTIRHPCDGKASVVSDLGSRLAGEPTSLRPMS